MLTATFPCFNFAGQAAKKFIFIALVGVCADHPIRILLRSLGDQTITILRFIRVRGTAIFFSKNGANARFVPQNLERPVGRAIVQRDDAIHMVANVMEETRKIPLLITHCNYAENADRRLRL